MKTQIQEKLNALVAERENILKAMQEMRNNFEAYRERVIELNGSIQSTQEMLQMLGDSCGDTESKAESGADSNEG